MKPLNWVELTRQQIKARYGFGWSIQGIEKQNKVITKIVYRFSNGQKSTVITDIEWNTNNSKKIQDLIIEFETLMNERHVDLKKAYELIIGNKVFSDKKKINWEALVDQFVNEERGNTAVFYPREWGEDAFHQWSPEKIDFYLKEGTK